MIEPRHDRRMLLYCLPSHLLVVFWVALTAVLRDEPTELVAFCKAPVVELVAPVIAEPVVLAAFCSVWLVLSTAEFTAFSTPCRGLSADAAPASSSVPTRACTKVTVLIFWCREACLSLQQRYQGLTRASFLSDCPKAVPHRL